MSNNPPYVSLDLDKEQAEWLVKLLSHKKAECDFEFKRWAQMSSSDPSSNMRSIMTMVIMGEDCMTESINSKMTTNPKLEELSDIEHEKAYDFLKRKIGFRK